MSLYDKFIDVLGVADRVAQREALRLLCELSDGPVDTYSISAPTGTGKSYAALVAGVHNAQKGLRTVIGTSTVLLSDQYGTDLEQVRKVFPDVTYFVLKGASHYFCGNKAGQAMKRAKEETKAKYIGQLRAAKVSNEAMPDWCQADPEFCSGCTADYLRTFKTTCEYARARQDALHAQVVVTTHAMISADMSIRKVSKGERNVLGKIHLIVFDEAHKASSSLTYADSISEWTTNNLAHWGCLDRMSFERRRNFLRLLNGEEFTGRPDQWYEPTVQLAEQVERVWPTRDEISNITALAKNAPDKEKPALMRSAQSLVRARGVLEWMKKGDFSGGEALWWTGKNFKFREMIPESGKRDQLLEYRVAWLSATIGTHSKPDYSVKKCGIETRHFDLPNAFDYSEQLSYFVRSESQTKEGDLLVNMNTWWKGGMVVLTPFHSRKSNITSKLRQLIPSELVQDQQSISKMNNDAMRAHIAAANEGENPVLVGVEIFSTGVDLPGRALTKLAIAGLFPLRDDHAYVAWRCRWLESFGGNGFEDFILPERAITLEQQIGRVIRRESDNGVVCFYVENKDAKAGSQGERIIAEALKKFDGIKELR